MAINKITKEEFLQKVWDFETSPAQWQFKGELPAVVYFSAKWCGPCRKMTPILEKLSTEYSGRVDIYDVDTDNNHDIVAALKVKALPTTFFCPMSGNYTSRQGIILQPELKKAIESIL